MAAPNHPLAGPSAPEVLQVGEQARVDSAPSRAPGRVWALGRRAGPWRRSGRAAPKVSSGTDSTGRPSRRPMTAAMSRTGVALVGDGVPGRAGRSLLQREPEEHGGVEGVDGRPALRAVARVAGHAGAAGDGGEQAGEAARARRCGPCAAGAPPSVRTPREARARTAVTDSPRPPTGPSVGQRVVPRWRPGRAPTACQRR